MTTSAEEKNNARPAAMQSPARVISSAVPYFPSYFQRSERRPSAPDAGGRPPAADLALRTHTNQDERFKMD
ncbi:MAG TPA: hypothetical protein VFA45_14045 [Actinomycetes bacterium]|nr:hypothetical protein [Actinomycetes bacterium]